ncbi:MAG: HAD family hydrolase [Clostridiales bacterium]|nr:HAD family hydrolase [Clostridiales bacterium]
MPHIWLDYCIIGGEKVKNEIRLVCVDLDGTLLKNNKTIGSKTIAAAKKAAEKGIEIVPVTGRPLSGLPQCVKVLPGVHYAVTSNGACVTEIASGRRIYGAPLSNQKSLQIMNLLNSHGYLFEAFADDVGYIEPALMEKYRQKFTGTPVGDYIFGSRRVVPDIRALFEAENKCADEIFINLPNESERDSLADLLAADETLGFCRLEKNFLEVLHRGTDKGTALEFLCSYFKIGRENAAAFGDNDNDLPLLAAAGLPVAMGNASEKVKNLAKTVTETNENDGVAMLLAQF